MSGLEFIHTYIDDLLVLIKGDWKLEEVFQRISDAGLKINAKKSFFGCDELEYLGYWMTRDGIQPIPKKLKQ